RSSCISSRVRSTFLESPGSLSAVSVENPASSRRSETHHVGARMALSSGWHHFVGNDFAKPITAHELPQLRQIGSSFLSRSAPPLLVRAGDTVDEPSAFCLSSKNR